MKATEAVHALAALAQETRLAIFRLLVERGPRGMTAGSIASTLDIVPATLSFHLKALSACGLLQARSESRYIHYSAHFGRMNELLAFLSANCCGGNPCVCARRGVLTDRRVGETGALQPVLDATLP